MNALRFSGTFKRGDLVMAARSLSKYRFDMETTGETPRAFDGIEYGRRPDGLRRLFVALAQRVSSKVITEDEELLAKFPADTLAVSEFGEANH